MERITTTKKTIYLLIRKYRSTGSVHDLPRGTRKKLNVQHYCFIDEVLSQDDEVTCTQLHEQLHNEFPDITVSLSTVKWAKKDLVGYQAHLSLLKRLTNQSELSGAVNVLMISNASLM